ITQYHAHAVHTNGLEENLPPNIAYRGRDNYAGHLVGRRNEVAYKNVARADAIRPQAAHRAERGALLDLAPFTDHAAHPLQLVGEPLVELNDLVERAGDLARGARPVYGHARRQVAFAEPARRRQVQLAFKS